MTGTTKTRRRSRKVVTLDGWRRRNDSGPHEAALPSGAVVRFTIPDAGTLTAAGRLPDELRELALLCAAHPDGAEGFMLELVVAAAASEDRRQSVTKMIEQGLEMQHHLVAAMLVEPTVTAKQIAAGELPELDVRMLLEFAERRRNLDAEGLELPIIVAQEWLRVGPEQPGENGARDGAPGRSDARGDAADANGGAM